MYVSEIGIKNTYYKKLPSFGKKCESDINEFIKNGAALNFDTAKNPDGSPYDGIVLNSSDIADISSQYINGIKSEVKLIIKNPDDKTSYKPASILTKVNSEENLDGSKTISYSSGIGEIIYKENYSANGKLNSSDVIKYKKKLVDVSYNPDIYSNNIYVPTDTALNKVHMEFYSDGHTLKQAEIDSQTPVYGCFNYKKTQYTPKGVIKKQVIKNKSTLYKDYVTESEVSKFDENGNLVISEGINRRYYANRTSEEPYAISKRITSKLNDYGRVITTEYDYSVLNPKGSDMPLKLSAFKLHPSTIRQNKNGKEIYYDGKTKKAFAAIEFSPFGGISKILNYDDATYTVFFHKHDYSLSKQYNKEGKLISKAAFTLNKYNYQLMNREYYNPDTGKLTKTETYDDSKLSLSSLYSENEKLYRREKYSPEGKLSAYAEFFEGKIVSQTIINSDGSKRMVKYLENNVQTEECRDKTGKLQSFTKYLNKLATERVIYNDSGEVIKTVTYKNGIPVYEENRGKRIKLEDVNFS